MNKSKIVIYVFGPKRVYSKYNKGEVLNKENGEWIKIGLRRCPVDSDAYQEALIRCKQESKTGIPEISYIYDVFQFPNFTNRKIDDEIRKILQVFNIETSMQNNKFVNEDEIPAGQEFVYGITKQQVMHAIHSFSYQILLEMNNEDKMNMIKYLEVNNKEDEMEEETSTSNFTDTSDNTDIPDSHKRNGYFNREFWNKVKAKLSVNALKDFHLKPSDYRVYKHWTMSLKGYDFCMTAIYSKRNQAVFICGYIKNLSNKDFYNLVQDKHLFDELSWENHIKRSGEEEKNLIFYKSEFKNSPEEKIEELANAINNLYEYDKH